MQLIAWFSAQIERIRPRDASDVDAAWQDGFLAGRMWEQARQRSEAGPDGRRRIVPSQGQPQLSQEPSGPMPAPICVAFRYRSSDGETTDRRVVVRRIDATHMVGVCLLREALRTFRLDRIVGPMAWDETGETATFDEVRAALGRSGDIARRIRKSAGRQRR